MKPPVLQKLRVLSYNVHGCIGYDGRFDPQRIADVIEPLGANFIAIQELENRKHDGRKVARFLADVLNMHVYYGPTLRRPDAHYGNVLLTTMAATGFRSHDITLPGSEPRGAIEARFDAAGQQLRVFATHLGLRAGERRAQLRQLMTEVQRTDADVTVLAGDINEWRPAGFALRTLHKAFGKSRSLRTYPSYRPLFALDRIFVMPAERISAMQVVDTAATRVASDHLPLLCELQLN